MLMMTNREDKALFIFLTKKNGRPETTNGYCLRMLSHYIQLGF